MRMSPERAKQQYLEQQVASASPARLVTMLYDRLLVDIDRAGEAEATCCSRYCCLARSGEMRMVGTPMRVR